MDVSCGSGVVGGFSDRTDDGAIVRDSVDGADGRGVETRVGGDEIDG